MIEREKHAELDPSSPPYTHRNQGGESAGTKTNIDTSTVDCNFFSCIITLDNNCSFEYLKLKSTSWNEIFVI